MLPRSIEEIPRTCRRRSVHCQHHEGSPDLQRSAFPASPDGSFSTTSAASCPRTSDQTAGSGTFVSTAALTRRLTLTVGKSAASFESLPKGGTRKESTREGSRF